MVRSKLASLPELAVAWNRHASNRIVRRRAILALGLFVCCDPIVFRIAVAEDWPQWRGPRRDAVSREVGLRQEWNSAPPGLAWRAEGLGEGYSSVVVSRGRVYTMGRHGEQVVCMCFEEQTGAMRWSRVIDQTSRIPCSTPTVDGDRVYVLDPDGDLYCLLVDSGEVLWHRSYLQDFGGVMMSGRGYGESPLVDGERLICTPGGPEITMAALDKHTGELIWQSAAPELGQAGRAGAGFSSPVMSTAAGVRQYVQLIGRGLIGVRASDGEFLWGYNTLANQTANIPTPVVHGDLVFAANGYNAGSVLLKLTKQDGGVSADPVYALDGSRFQNHHGGVALLDGYIYGGHGSNNGLPTCLQLETGKVQWKRRGPGVGSAAVVYADRRLYYRYQNGLVALINATSKGYDLQGTFQLPGAGGDSWSHPVVANGRLLLREKDRLFAYDVREVSRAIPSASETTIEELSAALQPNYSGASLFRYARSGDTPVVLERIGADEITGNGTLTNDVADRLKQARGDVVVDLAGLPISDRGLAQLATTPRLRGINLELCGQITDRGIEHLQQAAELRVLRLTGTGITNDGLQHLTTLRHLSALDLEVCEQVTDDGCRALGTMRQLKALILKKTGFEPQRITPAGLEKLGGLKALESLSLYGNQIDDDSLATLAELTNLRELDLSLTAISDTGLAHLASLSKLERLDLLYSVGFAGPLITDAGLESLHSHRHLRSLNLVGAKITDVGLQPLSRLEQLQTLWLASTRLSDAAVEQLQLQLPKCRIVR
ncbi:MAG: PQQ-binding-like beta-propeller repeat protein [Planctomycetota bacterium]|nr:PQQ-binding-like beta-propeller repeat protein [Planctomycetota bacterium]